jgi:iron complex outermembrane receptor protein
VIRAAPTADDVAFFAGTGLAPVGQILEIRDQFKNLQPQTVSGVDIGLNWCLRTENLGRFSVNIDAPTWTSSRSSWPRRSRRCSTPAPPARSTGDPADRPGDLLRKNGKPEWKGTGTITWRNGPVQIGGSVIYTGSVRTPTSWPPTARPWTVKSLTTANLYVQYRFEEKDGLLSTPACGGRPQHLRQGSAPVVERLHVGSLYNPYARYWFHYEERRAKLGRRLWDVVILQDLSTLDRDASGRRQRLSQIRARCSPRWRPAGQSQGRRCC